MSSSSPSCSGACFSLSSGGGLGGLFHDACSLSSSGGLGGLFHDACILSSSGGLGGLFHDACSLSSSGGLGGLFCDACTLSSSDSSENGSIFNSNVLSSSTILCHLELDSLSCVLCDALLLCYAHPFQCLLPSESS